MECRVLVPAMYRCNLVTCVDDVSSVCVCVGGVVVLYVLTISL